MKFWNILFKYDLEGYYTCITENAFGESQATLRIDGKIFIKGSHDRGVSRGQTRGSGILI